MWLLERMGVWVFRLKLEVQGKGGGKIWDVYGQGQAARGKES